MFKTLFTLTLLAGSLQWASATEGPFRKTPSHPALERVKQSLAAPAAAMRTNTTFAMPDSMHFSSWENNSWQLKEVAGLRFDAQSRLQRMYYYDQPGAGSRSHAFAEYQYNAAGKITTYSVSMQFAGLQLEQFRLAFNYDANGNKTSGMISMLDSLGGLIPVFGDSISYAYNQNNEISTVTFYVYDFANLNGWAPVQRLENITWFRGVPSGFESSVWDDTEMDWSNHRKFVDVRWGFEYRGFDRLFATIELETAFTLYEPIDFRHDEPTDYLIQDVINNTWVDAQLRTSLYDNQGRVSSTSNAIRAAGRWEEQTLIKYDYSAFGMRTVSELFFNLSTNSYIPVGRTSFENIANGSMSRKRIEMHNGTNWEIVQSNAFTYTLNGAGQLASKVVREWNFSSEQYDNLNNTEYFYRQVAASTKENAQSLAINAYPNPTKGQLQVALPETKVDADIRIRNLQGQLLYSQHHSTSQGIAQLSLDNLPAGIYLLEAISGSQHGALRIVKQ